MDESDASQSPDSVGGPMFPSQKKDKLCLVCGDKALGYNFNAVSCESCKAFFRRNAHKTIRGRCEGKCDVNVESRSFCKRCRLAKCFTVGMRKEMILDDDQKKIRKQKILINKLRRHGTLPPEDTYAVSETDLKHSLNQKIVTQSFTSLKKQYPSLSQDEIKCLYNIKDESDGTAGGPYGSGKSTEYEPWQDIRDNLEDVISDMNENDKHILLELNAAHESSQFLSTTETKLKSLPTTPTEVFNIADGFVRRIIKVVKQLEFFRHLGKEDQIALLKGSVVEIMMLRSAVNFDIKTETWTLNTKRCIKPTPSATVSSSIESDDKAIPPLLNNSVGLNIEELSQAARNGADINALRNLARMRAGVSGESDRSEQGNLMVQGGQPLDFSKFKMMNEAGGGMMNVAELRKAAMNGADLNTLREMAKQKNGYSEESAFDLKQTTRRESVSSSHQSTVDPRLASSSYQSTVDPRLAGGQENIEDVKNSAQPAGLDINALRNAAMNGASFEDLARMARGEKIDVKEQMGESSTNISSEILKMGNSETRTMFHTYSKFIRSLMKAIQGDLIVLKILIMLSLFSPDRADIENRQIIEHYQETYAHILQKYIQRRFPDNKMMFAQCIMKLTDLRNVNEVHTKMLLKMQIQDIEPLLVEIFDLPQ